MPRLPICLNPDDKNESFENYNADVCRNCWNKGLDASELAAKTGCDVKLVERALSEEDTFEGCEHPDYDDCEYRCELCESQLTSEDN